MEPTVRPDPAAEGAAPPPPSRWRWLRWPFALATVAAIVWVVPLRDRGGEPGVLTIVHRARVNVLAWLLGAYVLASVTWALRWRALLPLAGLRPTLLRVWRVTLESQAAAALIPTAISGDAVRMTAMTRDGGTVAEVAATLVLDRMVGFGALLLIALTFVTLAPDAPARWRLALGLALLAVAAGFALLRTGWIGRVRWFAASRVGRAVMPALEVASGPRALGAVARSAFWGLAVAAINFSVIRAVVGALGGRPHTEASFFTHTAMIFVGVLLPGVPGTWEAMWIFFLGGAGVSASVALGACVLMRAYAYALALLGALSLAWGAKRAPPGEAP